MNGEETTAENESGRTENNASQNGGKKPNGFLAFLKRKGVSLSLKTYFVDAMSAMALGLFATLLLGTILQTLGKYCKMPYLTELSTYCQSACGVVLGIAVAFKLGAPPLVLFSAGVCGLLGYNLGGTFTFSGVEKPITAGPAGAFFCALVSTEIGKLISKETPVDILLTPLLTVLSGFLVAKALCFPIAWLTFTVGNFVNKTTAIYPVFMGAIVGIVVGVVLTLPVSSAALCAMLSISGVAGGAAAAGCCAQMIVFAVISFKENKVGGLVAQGLGTSMLQMGNIVKNPWIWLPAVLSSGVCGSLSAAVFSLPCTGVSAGMGTCGFVGVIGVLSDLSALSPSWWQWLGVPICLLILPALLGVLFYLPLKKWGKIKDGDMKLEL